MASITRTVPVLERMTIDWVEAPPGTRRTPFSMLPLVTPVAANMTLPWARSSSPYFRSRSVIPQRPARAFSSLLRNRGPPRLRPAEAREGAPRQPAFGRPARADIDIDAGIGPARRNDPGHVA